MTSPTAKRLRAEARVLRQTADRMLYEGELTMSMIVERVTALKSEVQRLEAVADEQDDLFEVQRLSGAEIKRIRKDVAA